MLSQEYPLSAKEVFARLQKTGINQLTYQASHKALKELVEEKVVVKEKTKYALDPIWIQGLKSFALDLSETYSRKGKVDPHADVISLHFSTLLGMLRFIVGYFESRFPNPEKKDSICVWKHPWSVVGFSEVELDHLRKLLKRNQHYALCPHSFPLDKMFSNMVAQLGKKTKLKAKMKLDYDMKIHGDYLAQIYFPKELKEELDKIYKETKSVEKLDYHKLLTRVAEKQCDILVVITKNKELAQHFRELALKDF